MTFRAQTDGSQTTSNPYFKDISHSPISIAADAYKVFTRCVHTVFFYIEMPLESPKRAVGRVVVQRGTVDFLME